MLDLCPQSVQDGGMPAKTKPKSKAAPDPKSEPDKLIRQSAGHYRTADDRFAVEQSATGWFIVDEQITNELGQPLMHGPMATLDAIRAALPDAREAKAPAAPKPPKVAKARKGRAADVPIAKAAPEPERTWVDDLPSSEAQQVRSLIRRLEQQGITDAADLARADYQGLLPVAATRLIERRLDALVGELPEDDRNRARDLVRRTAEVLSGGGGDAPQPLPRWALVEQRSVGQPDGRRIVLLGSEKRRR